MPFPWSDTAVVAQILAPGGIAALAVKMVLNGSRDSIRRIERKQGEHGDLLADLSERTVRIETILDSPPRPRRRAA